jgi:hypothetical protein
MRALISEARSELVMIFLSAAWCAALDPGVHARDAVADGWLPRGSPSGSQR